MNRCWIQQCESFDTSDFYTNWTSFAIPSNNGILDSCSQFAYIPTNDGVCNEENFDKSQRIPCDGYISKDREERLVNHVSVSCQISLEALA